MIGRRGFLQLGPAALASTLVLDWNKALGAVAPNGSSTIKRGIVDQRFAISAAFGRTLADQGIRTTDVRDDVARLWYDDLRTELRTTQAPFAGLTDRSTLFCLEELARDVGMRVVVRVDHLIDTDGRVQHDVTGSPDFFAAAQLQHADESLGQLAGLLVTQDSSQAPQAAAQKKTGPGAPEHITALVTWVIA
jgi:hypothetical protein